MFEVSSMLRECLEAQPRDMYDIINAIEGYLDADPEFATNDFRDAIQYVLNLGIRREELYQEFDASKKFIKDESKWDYDYYALARVYLDDNFCPERIDHVEAIARKLYPRAREVENRKSQREARVQNLRECGGQQTNGKKYQNNRTQKGERQIITEKTNAKIKVGIAILFLAVLILIIAFIIKR